MLKSLLLLATVALLEGCATTGELMKCQSLRGDLRDSTSVCDECLGKLLQHGEPDACSAYCAQPGKVAPLAFGHCAAAAQEVQLQEAERVAKEKARQGAKEKPAQ